MIVDEQTVLGREPELHALRSFVSAVPSGPCALVLEGEAGIGKTTLWLAGVALSREASHRVLTCRPVEPEAHLSYAALADLMEDAIDDAAGDLPDLQQRALQIALLRADPDSGRVDHRTVSAAALGVLRSLSRERPVLLGVDDEQWLDASSAAALGFAVRRLRDEPVGLLATRRSGESALDPIGLARAMSERQLQRVRVAPLSIDAVGALINERLGLRLSRPMIYRMHEASRGNPFFALELARVSQGAGSEPGPGAGFQAPEDLRELLRSRLTRLPSSVHEVLIAVAAMANPTLSLTEAAVTRPQEVSEAVAAAAQADVIEVVGEEVRFTHPLFASAVYSATSDRERREVHRRLARVGSDVEERARHLAMSALEPDVDIAAALEEAAHHARERGAPAAAAELCESAARFTPSDRPEDHRRLQLAAADHHFLAGDQERAVGVLGSVLASCPPGGDRAEALVHLGRIRLEDDLREAALFLTEALEQEGSSKAIRAEALTHLAVVQMNLGNLGEAERNAGLAVDLAEGTDDPYLIADALAVHAVPQAYIEGRIDHDALTRAEALAGGAERFRVDWDPSAVVAELYVVFDRTDEAREIFLTLLDLAVERGDEPSASYIRSYLARLELRAGDWDQALRHSTATRLWGDEGMAGALVLAHRGELEAARVDALESLITSERSGHIGPTLEALEVLGAVELLDSDPAAAHGYLWRAWELVRRSRAGEPNKVPFLPDEIEGLIQLGQVDRAEQLLTWLEDRGRVVDRPRALATAARCRGLLLGAEGDAEGALVSLDRAMMEHERFLDPFELGRTLLVAGSLRRRAKQKRPAREALEMAGEIFERLGAVPWMLRVQAEVAAIGGRPPATGELTPTEERVARLAAAGQTNREIGATLFVSPRTVETHLSHVYRKLGVRSRTELASIVDAHGVRR